ncbi:FecR family protein [Pseudomonas typographi]|uniref:FecR family protein n=1 Tax=Pseudomonas typographi TaxID=2715964 RepID=A0ABR7Z753_9PSED|nr:FecR family protein [Pseudomonas typographi]MBD1554511.1 FecR family protein [Pseudomonas typographi]MBD1589560.1 FecR family protein [Pseudomonas typographi]MBD1601375.1 FecR family protein [Pseudomonas typographi]
MSSHASPDPSSDRISDEAARWCMRLHEQDLPAQERERFEQWLNSDPAHRREFDAMMEIWTISEFLPTPHPAVGTPAPRARRAIKRPWVAAAVLLAGLPILGLVGWEQGWVPNDYQRYQSGAATRDVTLADGSHVQLNLGTQLAYANYKDRRSVTLGKGEAYFEVKHDASHPFMVDAGPGQVRVTGTKFNVWSYQDEVVVTLTEGSVKVLSDRRKPAQVAYLSPDMQARYNLHTFSPEVSAASPSDALAWREGKLVLRDVPLDQALAQINRYLPTPIHLADRPTGQLRIGGIYNTANIASLVEALPKVLPVYLSHNDEGETVVQRKGGL